MRLIIAGSRDFQDYWALERAVLDFLKRHREGKETISIISGGARGADKLGERFADRFGLEVILKLADWKKHGKAAGMIRNREMAEIASHAILFWNGISRGTNGMLDIAEKLNLTTEVVRV